MRYGETGLQGGSAPMFLPGFVALSTNKWCIVFLIDLPDFFQSVDIWLIDAFDASAAAVITAGAEFTIHSAEPPERPVDDLFPFFSCRIFDQK